MGKIQENGVLDSSEPTPEEVKAAFLEYQQTGKMNAIVKKYIDEYNEENTRQLSKKTSFLYATGIIVLLLILIVTLVLAYMQKGSLLCLGLAIFLGFDLVVGCIILKRK